MYHSNNELADELNDKYNIGSVGFAIDITNESAVEKNANQLIEDFKKIDGLVNNAANNPKVENISEVNFGKTASIKFKKK